LRLRQRGNASVDNDDDANNDAAPSVAAAASTAVGRTALGNISNREGNEEGNNDKKSKKPKKPSGTTSIVERVRNRGRTATARAKESSDSRTDDAPEDGKPAAASSSRRTSSRRAQARRVVADEQKATKKQTVAAEKKKKETTTKEKETKKKAAMKKETAASKRGGVGAKRSSGEGTDHRQNAGRAPKRARRSTTATVAADDGPVAPTAVRASRSRSRSTAASSRRRALANACRTEVLPAGEGRGVVPRDFGLSRESFDGRNFTYGIAHYDAEERKDVLRCKDYVADMFQHMYHSETDSHPTPYMDQQDDINEKMRAILVDWLVEVHMKFRLVPETLYLCVNIIDRYCSTADVARSKLQLVGVTALFLACKHEEIYPPEVRDCVYITDRAYDRQEVLDMEQTILRALNWRISLPTAHPFLDRFLGLADASPMTRQAATYYLERTLQEHELLGYRPSMVCCSAVILALNNPDIRIHEEEYERELPGLPKVLMEYTEFDEDELWECMGIVARKVCEPAVCASRRQLTAVKKKYENRKYHSVSSALEMPSVLFVKEHTVSDE